MIGSPPTPNCAAPLSPIFPECFKIIPKTRRSFRRIRSRVHSLQSDCVITEQHQLLFLFHYYWRHVMGFKALCSKPHVLRTVVHMCLARRPLDGRSSGNVASRYLSLTPRLLASFRVYKINECVTLRGDISDGSSAKGASFKIHRDTLASNEMSQLSLRLHCTFTKDCSVFYI